MFRQPCFVSYERIEVVVAEVVIAELGRHHSTISQNQLTKSVRKGRLDYNHPSCDRLHVVLRDAKISGERKKRLWCNRLIGTGFMGA